MLTVLNISQNHFIRGGSDRYFFTMAALLQKHGHNVIPFTAANPKNEPSEWEQYFPRAADLKSRDRLTYYVLFIHAMLLNQFNDC